MQVGGLDQLVLTLASFEPTVVIYRGELGMSAERFDQNLIELSRYADGTRAAP